MKYVAEEWRRAGGSARLWLCVAVYIAFIFTGNWFDFREALRNRYQFSDAVLLFDYPHAVSYLLLLLPLLAALPHAQSHLVEWRSGSLPYIVMRLGAERYIRMKWLSVFLIGGGCLALGGGTCAILCRLVAVAASAEDRLNYYAHFPDMFAIVYLHGGDVYLILRVVLLFLFGGAFATASLAISAFIASGPLALILPTFLSRAWLYVLMRVDWPHKGLLNIMLVYQGHTGATPLGAWGSFFYAAGVFAGLAALFYALFRIGARRMCVT